MIPPTYAELEDAPVSTSALNDTDPRYALRAELLDLLQGCYLGNPASVVTTAQLFRWVRNHPPKSRCFCWTDLATVRTQLHWLAREGDVAREAAFGRHSCWSLGQPGRELVDAARAAGIIP